MLSFLTRCQHLQQSTHLQMAHKSWRNILLSITCWDLWMFDHESQQCLFAWTKVSQRETLIKDVNLMLCVLNINTQTTPTAGLHFETKMLTEQIYIFYSHLDLNNPALFSIQNPNLRICSVRWTTLWLYWLYCTQNLKVLSGKLIRPAQIREFAKVQWFSRFFLLLCNTN